MTKKIKMYRLSIKPSEVKKFRDLWIKRGYDLVDITPLCEAKIGNSGWCNDINEPGENIYYIRILYRGEQIANGYGEDIIILIDNNYVLFRNKYSSGNFIIFKKCRIENA